MFGVFRVGYLDPVALNLANGQDLPRVIAGKDAGLVATARLVLGLGLGLGLVAFAFMSREFRTADSMLGGLGIGLAIVAVWAISGSLGYVAEDPNSLEEKFVGTNSGRLESLSFVAPVAYTLELLMLWSDKSRVLTLGIAAVLGLIAGSFVHALVSRQFRWEGFRGTEDTANHLVGAALMGVGGVTAMGCTVGQGLSGVSTLAIGSFMNLAIGQVPWRRRSWLPVTQRQGTSRATGPKGSLGSLSGPGMTSLSSAESHSTLGAPSRKIGRASCRERVSSPV